MTVNEAETVQRANGVGWRGRSGGTAVTAPRRRPFTVDPWCVCEPELDLAQMATTESVFALSNGHLGLRGNLDEGDPHALPGSYLNSFYESRPLPYAEAGYGYPESGQTMINITDAKLIRLLVDDEPLDMRNASFVRTGGCWTCVRAHSPGT